MNKYHKIQSIYKRTGDDDPRPKGRMILGVWSLPVFDYLQHNIWQWREKVDGTNIRVMWDGLSKTITFGGKTDNAMLPAKLVERLEGRFKGRESLFNSLFQGSQVCLYGEGFGSGIQKGGGNYCGDQDFALFDVRVEKFWLEEENILDIQKQFGLFKPPVVGRGTLHELHKFVEKGFESTWGPFQAEGIVAVPEVGIQARNGDRIITKLKIKDFENCATLVSTAKVKTSG